LLTSFCLLELVTFEALHDQPSPFIIIDPLIASYVPPHHDSDISSAAGTRRRNPARLPATKKYASAPIRQAGATVPPEMIVAEFLVLVVASLRDSVRIDQ
jgi:hypothetical protein